LTFFLVWDIYKKQYEEFPSYKFVGISIGPPQTVGRFSCIDLFLLKAIETSQPKGGFFFYGLKKEEKISFFLRPENIKIKSPAA